MIRFICIFRAVTFPLERFTQRKRFFGHGSQSTAILASAAQSGGVRVLRLRCAFLSRPWPLLGASFASSGFGFLFFTRLPPSRFFAFLALLLLAQIRPELFISKTAAQPGSSNRKRGCDLDRPLPRGHVPWTLVQWIPIRKRKAATRCTTLARHSCLSR